MHVLLLGMRLKMILMCHSEDGVCIVKGIKGRAQAAKAWDTSSEISMHPSDIFNPSQRR